VVGAQIRTAAAAAAALTNGLAALALLKFSTPPDLLSRLNTSTIATNGDDG
jgi:hypothetical protein